MYVYEYLVCLHECGTQDMSMNMYYAQVSLIVMFMYVCMYVCMYVHVHMYIYLFFLFLTRWILISFVLIFCVICKEISVLYDFWKFLKEILLLFLDLLQHLNGNFACEFFKGCFFLVFYLFKLIFVFRNSWILLKSLISCLF